MDSLTLTIEWALAHQRELLQQWRRARHQQPLQSIPPRWGESRKHRQVHGTAEEVAATEHDFDYRQLCSSRSNHKFVAGFRCEKASVHSQFGSRNLLRTYDSVY